MLPLTRLEEPASKAVGASKSDVRILVMSLPGVDGTTLELITGTGLDGAKQMLTFYVRDVDEAANRVVEAGGAYRGQLSEFAGPSGDSFRFVFMTDPRGNVIDLFTRAR